MLTGPPSPCFFSPTVFFAGSGDKRDFFLYFCLPFNVNKNSILLLFDS